jgi:hypothetical protein
MWLLLYKLGVYIVLAITYLKIGDLLAIKGHQVWRRRRPVEDRFWQWFLFPYDRAGKENTVGGLGQGALTDDAARSPTCPHRYRILLALLWPGKLAINALCWTILLTKALVLSVVRLLCGLVMLAIDPKEAGRRLIAFFRKEDPADGRSPRLGGDWPARSEPSAAPSAEPPEAPVAAEPPAEDPLYPRGGKPVWLPNTDADQPPPAPTRRRGGADE